MAKKAISPHKRLAMGEEFDKYASGGMVKRRMSVPKVPAGKLPSPMTEMKRSNGVPGMKKGGTCGCK